MTRLPHLPVAGATLIVLIAPQAHAQTPPDAGALQQQIEREQSRQLPRRMAPEKPAAPEQMKPSGLTVTVREFRFAGNTLLPAEKLAPVVAAYLGRPLDFAQLQAAATAVANAYREAGWIVRAYLPKQEIHDGVVTIQIVEAVLGKLIPEGDAQRLKLSTVLSHFGKPLKPGAPLNADALDRALLISDDLPGVTVSAALQPGAGEGETDIVLKLADEPLIGGTVGLDNTGPRSTGQERLTGNLGLNSPLGLGDRFSANLLHSRGSDYARMAWSLPVGADGWRLGVNASRLNYTLVAKEFRPLKAKGDSTSFGLEASYPLIRSRLKNLFLALSVQRGAFDNRTLAGTSSRYRIDSASAGLYGNLFDTLGGGGANSASLALTQGRMDLGTVDLAENPALDGRFSKLRYSLARQQVISQDLSLSATFSGQSARQNLDTSEKFYLGGAYGVRAYPANEGGGDRGQLLNLELRWLLPAGFNATAFYDWGRVTQNIHNSLLAAHPDTYSLSGHGLALGWTMSQGLNLKAIWARREGHNPNRTAAGKDQDGSDDKNRWWFVATLPF